MQIIWRPSPNFHSRQGRTVDAIVLHSISLPAGRFETGCVEELFQNRLDPEAHPSFPAIAPLRVSAHYLIHRRGTVTRFVEEEMAAWHAGESSLEGEKDVNRFSVGIELEGDAVHPFTAAQYGALTELCLVLMERHPAIVPRRIVGHSHVAPGRKYDPGPTFHWERFRRTLREKRLAKMPVETKTGQMIMAGPPPQANPEQFRQEMASLGLGFAILFEQQACEAERAALWCRKVVAPLAGLSTVMVAIDQEGGRVMRIRKGVSSMPPAASLGKEAGGDESRVPRDCARELAACGVFLNLAPVADVSTDPPSPVMEGRCFGTDPDLVGHLAGTWVSESQAWGVASCLKHFPGHGAAAGDSHLCLPVVDKPPEELMAHDVRAFALALAARPAAVMTAHILYPGLDPEAPATLSRPIVTGLLREKLGFSGLVITDDLEMAAISRRHDVAEAAVAAVEAGADVILVSRQIRNTPLAQVHRAMMRALESGRLTEERIDASVERILAVKDRYAGPAVPLSAVRVNIHY